MTVEEAERDVTEARVQWARRYRAGEADQLDALRVKFAELRLAEAREREAT